MDAPLLQRRVKLVQLCNIKIRFFHGTADLLRGQGVTASLCGKAAGKFFRLRQFLHDSCSFSLQLQPEGKQGSVLFGQRPLLFFAHRLKILCDLIAGHCSSFACDRHPPGDPVQIQMDILRGAVHIAVLCRKSAQFIQCFFACKCPQCRQAELHALPAAIEHCFV